MSAIRIALIGGGWVVQNVWLPLLVEAGAEPVCVVDPAPEVGSALLSRFPGIRIEPELSEKALAGCDAAFICSPNVHHVGHAVFALTQGIHVILEKPACFSLEQAEHLIGLSRCQQCGLWVTSASSCRSDVRRMAEQVRVGALGRLHCVDVSWRRQAGIPRLGSWFTRAGSAIAGSGGDLGWHLLEVALGLLDYPTIHSGFSRQVRAAAAQRFLAAWRGDASADLDAELSVDTQLFGCLLIETGAVVRLSTAWASHQERDETTVLAYGDDGELALHNTFGFSTNGTREPRLTLARLGVTEELQFDTEDKIAPYRAFVQTALERIGCASTGDLDVIEVDYRKLRSLGSAMGVLYSTPDASVGISCSSVQDVYPPEGAS